jgi:hypothetical protein
MLGLNALAFCIVTGGTQPLLQANTLGIGHQVLPEVWPRQISAALGCPALHRLLMLEPELGPIALTLQRSNPLSVLASLRACHEPRTIDVTVAQACLVLDMQRFPVFRMPCGILYALARATHLLIALHLALAPYRARSFTVALLRDGHGRSQKPGQ